MNKIVKYALMGFLPMVLLFVSCKKDSAETTLLRSFNVTMDGKAWTPTATDIPVYIYDMSGNFKARYKVTDKIPFDKGNYKFVVAPNPLLFGATNLNNLEIALDPNATVPYYISEVVPVSFPSEDVTIDIQPIVGLIKITSTSTKVDKRFDSIVVKAVSKDIKFKVSNQQTIKSETGVEILRKAKVTNGSVGFTTSFFSFPTSSAAEGITLSIEYWKDKTKNTDAKLIATRRRIDPIEIKRGGGLEIKLDMNPDTDINQNFNVTITEGDWNNSTVTIPINEEPPVIVDPLPIKGIVGGYTVPQSYTMNGTSITMNGIGKISGSENSFYYAFCEYTGDFTASVEIATIDPLSLKSTSCYIGLMACVPSTLGTASASDFLYASSAFNGNAASELFTWKRYSRNVAGTNGGSGGTAPIKPVSGAKFIVRLVRTGSTINVSSSFDGGNTWSGNSGVGFTVAPLPEKMYVGLFVNDGTTSNSSAATVTFKDFKIQ